jgi:internalin A
MGRIQLQRSLCFWLSICLLATGVIVYPYESEAVSVAPSPILIPPILPPVTTDPPVTMPDLTLPAPELNPVITFPDAALSQWVKEQLDMYVRRGTWETIRKSDIIRYCERSRILGFERVVPIISTEAPVLIRSLEGIQAFASCNYKEIILSNQKLTDLTPLRALTTLVHIGAPNNEIESISALGSLTGLKTLSVPNNRIRSLAGLEGLINLQTVTIRDNEISDLEVIRHWTRLEHLVAGDNSISSLEPLSHLPMLRTLKLYKLNLRNEAELTHLRRLTTLKELDIAMNGIADITPISGLTNLRILSLMNNNIKDLSPLAAMSNLERLYVSNNRMKELDSLKPLTGLRYVAVSHNWISSLKPLQEHHLLEAYFSHNRIDLNSTDNIPAIVLWRTTGAVVELNDQDLNKVYPYEEGSAVPEGAAPGTTGSGTTGPGTAVPGTTVPGAPVPGTTGSGTTTPGTTVPGAGSQAPTRGGHSFTDIAGHWAEADIQWAYENGMVSGVGEGIFLPAGTTTEEQYLKMLLIAMRGLTEDPASTPWSQKYYDFALDYSYPVNPAQRNEKITRTTVAELIAATQGERLTGDLAIQYLLDHRLSSGKTSATIEGYDGKSYLTRAEAVRFIRNVITNAENQTPQRLR